jgi:hypothetical protein
MTSDMRAAALLAALCLAVGAGSAQGQPYVDAPCPANAKPAFEDPLQSLWYRRFWTGECKELSPVRCRSGRPYWNDIVRSLAARAPAGGRADVAARACRLGRRIGVEWTRPRAQRRIDTGDLKSLAATLEKAPDVAAGLRAVEARVREKIGP